MDRVTSAPKLIEAPPPAAARIGKGAAIVRLPQTARSDAELVGAMRRGEEWAAAALLDRYGPLVERLIRRIMGNDADLADLVQDAFATILSSMDQVRDENAVKAWMSSIAVHTAHHAIRRRKLTRWIFFWQKGDACDMPGREADLGGREALRRVYTALDQLSAGDRVVFTLRFIDEMPLEDVAAACDMSLATVKRKIARAEQRFVAIAKRDPVLRPLVEEGRRWT
jgi:RNA polymerase sigma-70 factor, ECF subfamily